MEVKIQNKPSLDSETVEIPIPYNEKYDTLRS